MRSVYILSGKPSAMVEKGPWLDSKGKALGFDLWIEVEKNQWIPASTLSNEEFAAIKDQLQHGIYYEGKLYTTLEVPNTLHKLIAAKEGLIKAFQERQTEIKAATSFKAFQEQIGNPLDQLIRQLEDLEKKITDWKTLETEQRQAKFEELRARAKRAKKKLAKLEEEQKPPEEPLIKPEDVQPHELDFLWDFIRAWKGKALPTEALQQLAKAQRISELAGEDLLLNPNKMRALRELLVS